MFRKIFSKETFMAILILWLSEGSPNGTPRWICKDPKGCPIVENTCPPCIIEETPKPPTKSITIIHKHTNHIIKETVREVAVPTRVIHEHIYTPKMPPSITLSNPKVSLAGLSRDPFNNWKFEVKVGNYTCSLPSVSPGTIRGTWRCHGETFEYFLVHL